MDREQERDYLLIMCVPDEGKCLHFTARRQGR